MGSSLKYQLQQAEFWHVLYQNPPHEQQKFSTSSVIILYFIQTVATTTAATTGRIRMHRKKLMCSQFSR